MFRLKQGFTLIEALITVALVVVGLLAAAGLQYWFSRYNSDKGSLSCLVQTLDTAKAYCSNMQAPASPVSCDGRSVTISVASGTCTPAADNCSDVTLNASYGGRTFTVTTKVCNFN